MQEQTQQGAMLDPMALFESIVSSARGLQTLLAQMKIVVPCVQIQNAEVDAQSIQDWIGHLVANGPEPMRAEVPLDQSEEKTEEALHAFEDAQASEVLHITPAQEESASF